VTNSGFTKAALAAFLKRRARSPLKAVVLDQEMFPGVGNWMADEVLWRCLFDPRKLAGTLTESEITTLWQKTRLVCRQAMKVIATDWNTPPDTWLFNHRWQDSGTCPCGAPLVRETIGERTTCWCPTCQES
jgi:formamidopyrimidine-DNA glycosylase